MSCEDFIIKTLTEAGIDYDFAREDIVVPCPFHSHSGTKKKLGFDKFSENGRYYCWVCGARGIWNSYADQLGLPKYNFRDDSSFSTERAAENRNLMKQGGITLPEKYNTDGIIEIPEDAVPKGVEFWKGEWRGLSEEFLATVPSFKWYDEASKDWRILWPVVQKRKVMGYTSAWANPHSTKTPKTRNLAGMKMGKCLFPLEHELIKDRVVLVEGQYDALRLLSKGIPALAILGTNQWHHDKNSGRIKTSLLLRKGIQRVVLAMDDDAAGRHVTEHIQKSFESTGVDVRVMEFPQPPEDAIDELERPITSYDPGNCPEKYLRIIKKMLK